MNTVEDHIGLATFFARLYSNDLYIEDTEEYAEALMGVHDACQTFDEELGVPFSSYAWRAMGNRVLNLKRSREKKSHIWPKDCVWGGILEEGVEDLHSDEDFQWSEEAMKKLVKVMASQRVLTSKQEKLISLMMKGFTDKELRDTMGITKQAVSRMRGDAIKKLQELV
jgi:RNA polymerase sigma factor (sigma-70 family)